ncbi:DUF5336 domain-containing protein [Actinokineospora soli]|uniref:DUF5336 domain-containing protein n=1 Tax=Actinokineospora soli TaxID=1048753 RepID=A0ABW2TWT2_9PSEU
MTYPGGAPGGYPGPGQQPPQAYGPPPSAGPKFTVAQMLHLGVAGLGALNFFLGFANLNGGVNYFEIGSTVPALFLVAGLLSLKVILPGEDKKPGLLPPALAVATALSVLFGLFGGADDTGAILELIFGLVMAGAAVAAFLMDAGIIKPPAPAHHVPYAQPGGYNPPSGQFGQQQPMPGQAPQQPGQFGQQPPPSGQATTFAPQQGQFGQAPGTPPGGYPQQPQQ